MKSISSRLEIPEEDWELATEFIDEHSRSRKTSDKFYAENLMQLGLLAIARTQGRLEELRSEHRDLVDRVSQTLVD